MFDMIISILVLNNARDYIWSRRKKMCSLSLEVSLC